MVFEKNIFQDKNSRGDLFVLQKMRRNLYYSGSLNCPYVIKMLGACLEDPSQFAIVTEFIGGGSLFCVLHEHRHLMDIRQKVRMSLKLSSI